MPQLNQHNGFLKCVLLSITLTAAACSERAAPPAAISLDSAAQAYLQLVLALAQHDPQFLVSYFGPQDARAQAAANPLEADEIARQARRTEAAIAAVAAPEDGIEARRRAYLRAQLLAVARRAETLDGEHLPFMQEAELVFGAKIPDLEARSHITQLHARINRIMPGQGLLADRIASFREKFIIPPDRLPAVIEAAVAACRSRTREILELPPERLEVEYASGVNWLTYNEFRGNGFSVIKINTDLPVYIDRALEMGCHEGYPGHHVSNVLKEQELVKKRGWQEFTVQTLFSPQTLVEEGLASYGVELVFPHEERIRFERDVLFELAGFDRAQAHRYLELMSLIEELAYADIEGARRYLDGEWEPGFTARWLVNYRLLSAARARQRLAVFDTYRSFIATVYLGRQLVRGYIATQVADDDPAAAWREFRSLLVTPVLPSDLGN